MVCLILFFFCLNFYCSSCLKLFYCFLFDIVVALHSFCSKLLFYSCFDMLFCSFCSTYYFAPFVWPIILLLLFNISAPLVWHCCSTPFVRHHYPSCSIVLFFSFCLTLLLILLNIANLCLLRYLSTTPMILLLLALFA